MGQFGVAIGALNAPRSSRWTTGWPTARSGCAFAPSSRANLLPRHARGQHRQRVAQVDHLVQAQPEKILGGRTVSHLELPENQRQRR